jgi:hypothetical protein
MPQAPPSNTQFPIDSTEGFSASPSPRFFIRRGRIVVYSESVSITQ